MDDKLRVVGLSATFLYYRHENQFCVRVNTHSDRSYIINLIPLHVALILLLPIMKIHFQVRSRYLKMSHLKKNHRDLAKAID